MNVLPLPVAIWISERGLFLASDRSRFSIALFCTDHSFEESSAGRAFSLPRTWASRLTSRSSSSRRWKVKTSRLRARERVVNDRAEASGGNGLIFR